MIRKATKPFVSPKKLRVDVDKFAPYSQNHLVFKNSSLYLKRKRENTALFR